MEEERVDVDFITNGPNSSSMRFEVATALGVLAMFVIGILGVYLSLPDSDYSFLKLPRSVEDIQLLRDNLELYANDYTIQVLVSYCIVYIFMQTFMIPGTIFMSLLAGALYGVVKGVALVVFAATAGASSCYFLSKMIGRPLVSSLWPDKLSFFQQKVYAILSSSMLLFSSYVGNILVVFSLIAGRIQLDCWNSYYTFSDTFRSRREKFEICTYSLQIASRRENLLNYMLFLRVTPTLPNTFINLASPIVNVPFHTFFLATSIGLIPASYVTVKAGIALGELRSMEDLYDFQSIAVLFFIGVVSITPTLICKKQ